MISLKRSVHVCRNRSVWSYFRTVIRLTRSVCICRVKSKKIVSYSWFSEKDFVMYVGGDPFIGKRSFRIYGMTTEVVVDWSFLTKLLWQSRYWTLYHSYMLMFCHESAEILVPICVAYFCFWNQGLVFVWFRLNRGIVVISTFNIPF